MNRISKVALAAASFAVAVVPTLTQTATAATFGTPVVVSSDNVTEPGVEVAPDGTIYVHGPTGIPLWSNVWRSDNGGASFFLTPSLTRAGLGGGDIDIAIQPVTGKLAFTDLWLGSSSVGSSADKGQTWITNQFQGTPVQDRQWVATTGRDIVYHVTHQLAAGLVVSKSVDGGVTYPVQNLAASTLAQNNCLCPPGYMIAEAGLQAAGIDDKIGVSFTTQTGVGFARSVNGGLTWTQSVIDPIGGGSTMDAFPVVANAGGGKLVAVYLTTTNSASTVWINTSSNWGSTWGTPRALINTGASVFPWVDARGTKVAVSVYHSTTSGNPSNIASSAEWYLKYLESTDGGATFGTLTTADATRVKQGPICVDGINCGSDRELGDFQMIALDNAGKAVISYVRSIDNAADTEVRFVKQTS